MNGSLHETTSSEDASETSDASDVILRALGVLAHNGLDGGARTRLARTEVLVPADDTEGRRLTLPVTGRAVLVFTSEERMAQALPDVQCYHLVPLGMIAAHWPGRGLALTIDPGSPEAVTLSVEGVHLLLGPPLKAA
ncbi:MULTISPECIES: SseB family protein [unclassified Streptomyces]|uniref:SseB family protein n=1 Tax=unclassified Streptomyces TaxID=2593676 RepID=UPI0033F595C5